MPINGGMDKEGAMEYYSVIKRNKTGPFAEMWMDLETVIQKEKKNHILCVESRKMMLMNIFLQSENRDTNAENKCMYTRRSGCGMDWEIGVDVYTLLILTQNR